MTAVLDASALTTYLEKDIGHERVKDLLTEAAESGENLLMSAVNWGEVFYVMARNSGIHEAERIQKAIETFPIDFVPADFEIARQAALYKFARKLPYADCFVAALAKRSRGTIVTADNDFRILKDELDILWIR